MCRNHRKDEKGGGQFRAGAFARGIIDEIMAQPGCEGIRIYMAKTNTGDTTLVAVGTDIDGNDLSGGTVANTVFPCPPFCGEGGLDS